MRLTAFSDFALRVLLFAHAHEGRLVTIEETAAAYGVSRAHLMKVVRLLAREGFLRAQRGRAGGFTLALPARQIRLGTVLRATEGDFALAECFGAGNLCAISSHCVLPNVLNQALGAFMAVLDGYTLADIALPAMRFGELPQGPQPPRGPVFARPTREPPPEAPTGEAPPAKAHSPARQRAATQEREAGDRARAGTVGAQPLPQP